jgi:nitrous oxidase accessory protein
MRNAVKYALVMTAMTAWSAITLAPVLAPGAASADAAGGMTFFVSAAMSSGFGDTSCATASYRTITDAIADAADGDTVVVCPGTYRESVAVDKRITLMGRPGAVIDASGWPTGVSVVADGATVEGLTVVVNAP